MDTHLNPGLINCVDDVLITAELENRPKRAPDFEAENRALTALGQELASHPQLVLQKLVELVIELCRADSAGISVFEPENNLFRWHATAGAFAPHRGGTMPRDASPCGTVIERNSVLLFRDPERYFPAFRGVEPFIHEGLLAPWTINGQIIGTVWAISHDAHARFDAEDARVLQNLAAFAAAGHQLINSLQESEMIRQELEQRVADRTYLLQEELEQRRQAEATARRLYELHARLATEDDLIAALDEILAAACELTHTDRGCVQLFSLDGQRLEIVAQRGYGPDSPFIKQFRYQGFSQGSDVARVERRRILIEDTETVPALIGTPDGAAARADGIRAAQSTPMISRKGEAIGVLSTQFRQPHRPTDDELRLIDLLAWAAADFVERHHAELALRESEARFRALADASPALIWQIDLGGNAVYLNQRYLDVTGKPLSALLATGWHAILHPEDTPGYLSTASHALLEQAAFHSRTRIKVKDGSWRWFETYAAPWYSSDERYQGHIGLSIDITDSIQAELALKEADRRKDDFLATLAHELRNPLAPISNAVHLLRRQDGRRKADRVIDMVGRQVNHMIKLVDDLLEISRITRGKIDLKKQPVALADIVNSAVEIAQPLIDQSHLHLTVTLPEEQILLDADRVRLAQVLSNMLNNSAKYTEEGGRIELIARRADSQVEIAVRDTGIGIAADYLPHVFEMFAQSPQAMGRSHGGLGIGLAMVRKLVEMHGGTVEARSEGVKQGSEFIVRLPTMTTGATDDVSHHGLDMRGVLFGQRILVVDDNRDAADSIAMLLELDGAEVRTVYDGLSALGALSTEHAHVVLLDLGMPGMDGYEVARRIRKDQRFQDVRIVALTGWGQENDRARTRQSGFDYHLTKPVDLDALKAILAATGDTRNRI